MGSFNEQDKQSQIHSLVNYGHIHINFLEVLSKQLAFVFF